MPKPKGGRGRAAPYKTRQVRMPEPIIEQVHELIERYQNHIAAGGNPDNPPGLLDQEPVDNFKAELEKLKVSITEAATILGQALHLKANTGGAIKREIEKALLLLQ